MSSKTRQFPPYKNLKRNPNPNPKSKIGNPKSKIPMSFPVAAFTVLMALLTLALPRRHALFPLLITGCLMTAGQRLFVYGLDFPVFRIVMLCGWARVIMRGDMTGFRLQTLDRMVLAWAMVTVTTGALLEGSAGFIHRLGVIYNAIGLYFLARVLIRDEPDLKQAVTWLALGGLMLVPFMTYEKITGNNMFAYFGGVPFSSMIRDGILRCQGPFGHPILAGSFGAIIFPLMLGSIARYPERRRIFVTAAVAAAYVTFLSASSGPFMTMLVACLAIALWMLRDFMRPILWLLAGTVIVLEIMMSAHIWFLVGRISNVIGGTGWHRAALIDTAFRYFPEWWIMGTTQTSWWEDYGVINLGDTADLTNQFIFEGVLGGILRMLLFAGLFVFAFRGIACARRRALAAQDTGHEFFIWCAGCALLAQGVTYLSVMYFDQMVIYWNLILALPACLAMGVGLRTVQHTGEEISQCDNQLYLPGLESSESYAS